MRKRKSVLQNKSYSPIKTIGIIACIFFGVFWYCSVQHDRAKALPSFDVRISQNILSAVREKKAILSSSLDSHPWSLLRWRIFVKKYYIKKQASLESILAVLQKSSYGKGICIEKISIKKSIFLKVWFSKNHIPFYVLEIYTSTSVPSSQKISKSVSKKKKPFISFPFFSQVKKQGYPVAIILDDWGYNLKNKAFIVEFNKPVTLAVLPDLPHSRYVAELGYAHNKEIILHMPMEPLTPQKRYERSTIFTTMNQDHIENILEECSSRIPYIRGINNHQGSKATADRYCMRLVVQALKKKNLFFLDSMTNQNSVAYIVARQNGVPSVKNCLFLDIRDDKESIRKQLYALVDIAQRNGYAVAIGHDRVLTVSVIREEAEQLEKKGIRLVKLSDIIKQYGYEE